MKDRLKRLLGLLCVLPMVWVSCLAQSIDDYPSINGADVQLTDRIMLRDVSSTGANAVRKMTFAELVNVPGLFDSVGVTAEGIATALSTANPQQESSILASLGAEHGTASVRGLSNSIRLLATRGAATSIIVFGDSFAALMTNPLGLNRHGRVVGSYRCGPVTGGGDSGATVLTGQYDKSPDGSVVSIASGGNRTCGHLLSSAAGPANRVYYTLFPGTGSAQLQYREAAGAWTNVGSAIDTTAISTVSIGAIALPATIQEVSCRVTATGGTVIGWIGQGLDGPGLTTMNFSGSGFEAVQNLDISETLWKAMVAGYKASGGAQIIAAHYADYRFANQASTAWAKGVDYYGPSGPWSTFRTWSKTANPDCDWLIVGAHAVDPARTDGADATLDPLFSAAGVNSSVNDRIAYTVPYARQWAIDNGEAYLDMFSLTTYAVGNAAGFYSDDIHMGLEGNNMKAARLVAESGLRHILPANIGKSVKVGSVSLQEMPGRTATGTTGLGIYDENSTVNTLGLLFASGLRAVNPTRPEEQGVEIICPSQNIAELRAYQAGSSSGMLRFEIGIPYPITNGTGSVGKAGNRFAIGYANAVATGYRELTGAHTIAAGDHTINILSGTFDITLPVSFSGGVNAGESGRELVFCNNGAGTVTLRTVSDGANLQKIDNATTLVLGPGQKAKLKSAGFLTSTDYRNWITLP
jgi:hypothetical protein